jgi:GT2 family glycosyltransferase
VESAADTDDTQTLAEESDSVAMFAPPARGKHGAPAPPPDNFDEQAYLEAFPDVAQAIESGKVASALQHFQRHGQLENRLSDDRYRRAVVGNSRTFPPANVDLVLGCNGYRFVSGWIADDESAPLCELALVPEGSKPCLTTHLARCRRPDAEAAGRVANARHVGFWTVLDAPREAAAHGEQTVRLSTPGERHTFAIPQKWVSDEQLRDTALDYFGSAVYRGDPQTEALIQLDSGVGKTVIELNMRLSQRMAQGAFCLRLGRQRARYDGTIVVCLYGKPEFLALQAALFSRCPGYEGYEFVYVSNSPELSERLIKDATIATRIYDLTMTLIILPGNVGFGLANNVGVGHARSDRILIVNPDVFPRLPGWPQRHRQLLEGLPKQQTQLFGVPLYYDNGSLMHAGMYFELDTGLAVYGDTVVHREMIRVEHHGKGAPPDTATLLQSRPVSAVTGAFMSMDRAWFERLDGFSPEYIYGHYEDADFCLRSLEAGGMCWLHDLPFWHFEGQGSSQRPGHAAGGTINRWYFTRRWRDVLHSGLLGRTPPALLVS